MNNVGIQGTGDARRITTPINVGDTERRLSMLSGVGLIVAGLRMGGLKGVLTVMLGADMVLRGTTGHCWMYRLLGINTAVKSISGGVAVPHKQGIHVEDRIVIQRPVDEVYDFWRNLENLPQFMHHLKTVEVYDDTRSRWTAKGPAGIPLSWDAEIINEQVDQRIAWRSAEGASVPNAGAVNFFPVQGGAATEVVVKMEYSPPGGEVGAAIARLLGEDPQQQIDEDLQRLKEILETATQPIMTDYSYMDHSYESTADTSGSASRLWADEETDPASNASPADPRFSDEEQRPI